MSKRFEVTYTYCIDASMVVEAETPMEAETIVEKTWKSGDATKEKVSDVADFEVLNVRKK